MNSLEFNFVFDLIFLSVPLLLVSLMISLFRWVSRPVFKNDNRVPRETNTVKSWCYDENEI